MIPYSVLGTYTISSLSKTASPSEGEKLQDTMARVKLINRIIFFIIAKNFAKSMQILQYAKKENVKNNLML